jgi:filamentous hemagglutinin family protein
MRGFDLHTAERRRSLRPFLSRTAICGALAGLAAAVCTPACAQVAATGPQMPVWSGVASASGAGPSISIGAATGAVNLNSARTVIDWSSFNVAGGHNVTFNFGARNWIVLNRINDSGPDNISGNVQGLVSGAFGGNIWFSARNGLIFGSGATVDAGGLLVTASSPNLTQFLDPSNLNIDFPGAGLGASGVIQIQSGAALTSHGGLVALIAQNVTSDKGSAVSALGGGSVLYGAAEGYTIHLATTTPGDLDLVDFIVPDAGSGSLAGIGLDLQNTTTANSVFVAAVSRAGVASTVINLEGMITATSAATSSGGDIILSGGGGIAGRLPAAATAGSTPTDFYLGQLTASRDIQLSNIGLTLAKPFPRPPKTITPPDLSTLDECVIFDCSTSGCPLAAVGCAPIAGPAPFILTKSIDDSFLSELSAGRDIKIVTLQEIDLGGASAARNLSVDGATLFANSLSAGGKTTLVTEAGDLHVGSVALGGDGAISAKTTATVDAVGFTGPGATLSVTTGADLFLGDGSGDVSGGSVNLTAGGAAIVNLGGNATLTTVKAGGSAILQAGALNIGLVTASQVLAKGGSVSVGTANSAGDVYVIATGGNAVVGTAVAGDDVFLRATGGSAQLTFATLTGAGPDAVGAAFDGNPDAVGNGRTLSVVGDVDAKVGFGAGFVNGATSIGVKAGRDAMLSVVSDLPSATSVAAGQDAVLQAPSVSFSEVSAGRDLTLNATIGSLVTTTSITAARDITLGAGGTLSVADIAAPSGSITLSGKTLSTGALNAGQDLTLTTTGGDFATTRNLAAGGAITLSASGALNLASVTAGAGSISLSGKSVTAGALATPQDLTLKATGGGVTIASYKIGRDLIAQGATLSLGTALSPVGRDLSLSTSGDFTAAADLNAGRNLSLVVGGAATLKGLSAPQVITLDVQGKAQTGAISGTDVHVVAADLDLGGTLSAQTAEIESRTGALRLGGSSADGAPASGLWLDAAELGRVHAAKFLTLYAGAVAGTARGDLTVFDLNLDPAATPQLNLYAGGGRSVLVQGSAAPTTSGGVVNIGDVTAPAWQPTSILISGALGAATFSNGVYSAVRDFADVRLHATQDIIMGSPRFISLIQATAIGDIDLGRNLPSGGAPITVEQNRVFVSTGRLELSAVGKVVNQNTSTDMTQSVGIFLTNKASPSLVIDPPKLVDIFGSFLGKSGAPVTGFAAGGSIDFVIVDSTGKPVAVPTGAIFHFDSCTLGTSSCSGASALAPSISKTGPVSPDSAIPGDEGGGAGSGSGTESDAGPLGDLGGPLADSEDTAAGKDGSSGQDAATETTAQAAARSAPGRTQTPPLATVAPRDPKAALNDPVTTGAGSEEIWRSREAKP